MSKLQLDLDFVSDDLQGDDDLAPYTILAAVGRWLATVDLSAPDTHPFDTVVVSTNGSAGGWPVVRFIGTLPLITAIAHAYANDEVEARFLIGEALVTA